MFPGKNRSILPRRVCRNLRLTFGHKWFYDQYANWPDARVASNGYEQADILERVYRPMRDVVAGPAVFDRAGAAYHKLAVLFIGENSAQFYDYGCYTSSGLMIYREEAGFGMTAQKKIYSGLRTVIQLAGMAQCRNCKLISLLLQLLFTASTNLLAYVAPHTQYR